jgi:dolichyl-phosphate-mannose--protein O-mannosyl transferase
MPAPPSVVGRTGDDIDERDRSTVEEIEVAENAGSPGTDELRPDPAKSVVAIGDTPALTTPKRPRRLVLPPMPTDRARGWAVTLILTGIAAVVRLVGLGDRTDVGTPLFDEKYYAIQAQEILRNGGVEDNQGFGVVVHPPFGKQLIAIGEWMFGYTPFGWRFASAVAGIVSVLLIVRVVRRMTRSTLLGGIAGVLLICDGVSHVQSRSALLDIFQAVFVLAAFACVVADRDQVRARLAAAVADGSIATHKAGIALGARWWRFGAGVLLGLTTAVKWSVIPAARTTGSISARAAGSREPCSRSRGRRRAC